MRVEWTEDALDRLADFYVAAGPGDRADLEQRVLEMNQALADDPWTLGESRATFTRRV